MPQVRSPQGDTPRTCARGSRSRVTPSRPERRPSDWRRWLRFADALRQPGLGAIAEVKRRSPSAGDLRPDADPATLAGEFERAGAAAVSILVDDRFGGTFGDLRAARGATRLPLLA